MVKSKRSNRLVGFLLLASLLYLAPVAYAEEKAGAWPAAVEQALMRAGTNRPELVKALTDTPREQRKGMVFLIANMSESDLRSLSADFLLENVALAYKARKEASWGGKIPEAIFLNDVLAYANVDEARHPWRKELYELCAPLVKDCKTSAEAAHRLNSTIFNKLKVRYSTKRKKPHQSPKESIEQGLASCTGLSILLSDACRSVAVPARLVGTPMWSNMRGNHTWVEIWDKDWHFAGAAEPDARGLDHGWFEHDASEAKKDSPRHSIYAASFRKSEISFPLVWARNRTSVSAENVTDRYTRTKSAPKPKDAGAKPGLSPEQAKQIEESARKFFAASETERNKWHFDSALDEELVGQEETVRRLVWKAYQTAPLHEEMKKDFEQDQVRYQKYLSPYKMHKVGNKLKNGWPLVIALHGGGGAPKRVNDSQWQIMQIYYRDQKSLPGYQYVALRAPNDSWNGFYDDYVPPLVSNLIRQFLLFGDVDSSKVYLIGYSHGGYGAFFIGPKIPDRFAAIHSSAAAATGGAISPRTLRNTRFTFMVGERDDAHGRRKLCEAFNEEIQKLKQANKGDYPVEMELKMGFGHSGLPDRDKIKELYPHTRNAAPPHLTWDLTDAVITHFFWLSVVQPAKGSSIDAAVRDNRIEISTRKVKQFDLNLDSRLLSFANPVRIALNGKEREYKVRPSFRTLCQSMLERGDPELAFTCRIHQDAEEK